MFASVAFSFDVRFKGTSQVVLVNLLPMQVDIRHRFKPWVGKISWRMA